jgi:hypothetical protein
VEIKMMITKTQFKAMTEDAQNRYLYLWSALEERKAEKIAIEFTESQAFAYKSELTGMELIRAKESFKVENHPRYESCLEDIETYEKYLTSLLGKYGIEFKGK